MYAKLECVMMGLIEKLVHMRENPQDDYDESSGSRAKHVARRRHRET